MRCVLRPVAEQTILITGGTDGLGRALAAELAAADATLLVHGRDDVRGRETIDEIHSRTGNENLHWLRADFASLDEVRTLAARDRRTRSARRARQQRRNVPPCGSSPTPSSTA